jgi:hypothetical protein
VANVQDLAIARCARPRGSSTSKPAQCLLIRAATRPPTQINVSRYGIEPWRQLSPFIRHAIPVPGRFGYLDLLDDSLEMLGEQAVADSVEGVWQGLKVINGHTGSLHGAPRKRRGRPEGHDFGHRLLDYAEAKALIYIPSYLHQLRLESALLAELPADSEIVDVSYQLDCLSDKPISHAALLVEFLNGRLAPYEAAHLRLLGLAQTMLDSYDREDVVTAGLFAMNERLRQIGLLPLTTYEACARLFEREALMLTIVRTTGSSLEMNLVGPMMRTWINDGLLSRSEAVALSQLGPVCRWTEQWLGL